MSPGRGEPGRAHGVHASAPGAAAFRGRLGSVTLCGRWVWKSPVRGPLFARIPLPPVLAGALPAQVHPRLGGGDRWGSCQRPPPTRLPGGREGLWSLRVKGEQPLFPKMAFNLLPRPVRLGADLCPGFGGHLRLQGHPRTPPHLRAVFALFWFQLLSHVVLSRPPPNLPACAEG